MHDQTSSRLAFLVARAIETAYLRCAENIKEELMECADEERVSDVSPSSERRM